jgi:hypothetical protein
MNINVDVDVNFDLNVKKTEGRRDGLVDQISERRNRWMG